MDKDDMLTLGMLAVCLFAVCRSLRWTSRMLRWSEADHMAKELASIAAVLFAVAFTVLIIMSPMIIHALMSGDCVCP